jgi:hypothetical protein
MDGATTQIIARRSMNAGERQVLLTAQYFAKTVEVIFKRSTHRSLFAFSRVS